MSFTYMHIIAYWQANSINHPKQMNIGWTSQIAQTVIIHTLDCVSL